MKRFVIGDIHGNYKGLMQCLERSKFDYENDLLISLGDIADGYSYVYDCVEELLKIKNRIDIKGNHDDWFCSWLETEAHPDNWKQGGEGTLKSYTQKLGFGYGKLNLGGWAQVAPGSLTTEMSPSDIPETHRNFWLNQKAYHKDSENNFFVHGGFNRHYTIEEHGPNSHIFWWDRDLFYAALATGQADRQGANPPNKNSLKFKEAFKNIFIGHTQVTYWGTTAPIFADIVINIDTGGGWHTGKVTIMNVDTKEYYQSDLAGDLYPGEQGRK